MTSPKGWLFRCLGGGDEVGEAENDQDLQVTWPKTTLRREERGGFGEAHV